MYPELTAEILGHSLAPFYCQYADRRQTHEFIQPRSQGPLGTRLEFTFFCDASTRSNIAKKTRDVIKIFVFRHFNFKRKRKQTAVTNITIRFRMVYLT